MSMPPPRPMMAMRAEAQAATTPVVAGELEIRAVGDADGRHPLNVSCPFDDDAIHRVIVEQTDQLGRAERTGRVVDRSRAREAVRAR